MIYRFAKPEDAAEMAAIHGPYVRNTAITFQVDMPNERFFLDQMMHLAPMYPVVVCEDEGRVIGFAYAAALRAKEAYQWCVETTVYLDPACRRRGVGSELYGRLLALLTAQGFAAAYACVTVPNAASDALHARFGFKEVGRFPDAGYKLGKWHDVVWLHRPLANLPDLPPPPTPVGKLPEDVVTQILDGKA